MKSLLACLSLGLLSLASHAQTLPTDSTTGKIVYRGIVTLPSGITPAQAFGRSKLWLNNISVKTESVVEDAGSGLLSGTGQLRTSDTKFVYRIRLQVEPAAVRYRVENFIYQGNSVTSGTAEELRDAKTAIGKKYRAKTLAELDTKVREGLAQLSKELAGNL